MDENGSDIMYPTLIRNCLQGMIPYGVNAVPCYLIQGKWYCMDEHYIPLLKTQFEDLYDKNAQISECIKNKFQLIKTGVSEDVYNNSFRKEKNIIVAHKAMINNYEIADLIFGDDKNIYLMCNKKEFNGEGSRDLSNQILGSADYFLKQIHSSGGLEVVESLYDAIEKSTKKEKKN